MKNAIQLLINRKWESIPSNNILYVIISDKLSFFHLKDGTTLSLFITLSKLEQQLPPENFTRVSRCCIVNWNAVRSVKNRHITLHNGAVLSYSKRREKRILEAYNAYTAVQKPSRCEAIAQRFLPLLNQLSNRQLDALEQVLTEKGLG